MNSAGVLFTLMVLFILLSLLSLHQAGLNAGYSLQDSQNMLGAYQKAADKFSNIRKGIVNLPANASEGSVAMRVLPFSYSIDTNRILLSSNLPATQASIDAYLEAVNYLRVFVEDANYSNQYDSIRVDVNTLTPASWGGSDRNVSFVVFPQCMRYSLLDNNSVRLDFTCTGHDFNAIKRLDLNISLGTTQDFNSLSCSFNGVALCPNNPFSPGSALPFLNLTLLDANCGKCALGQKTVGVHFNPDANNYVQVKCAGAACASKSIDLNFTRKTSFTHSGTDVEMVVGADMNSAIGSFELSDTDILVANDYFGVRIWK